MIEYLVFSKLAVNIKEPVLEEDTLVDVLGLLPLLPVQPLNIYPFLVGLLSLNELPDV